nr:FadR/GntR family transcriptional regulator [uncultured Cellulosilyticum sp.]
MFENINSGKLLPERIADEIIELIARTELKVGDKLPSEAELMKSLNVGRSSLREAIKILVSRNIVEIKRGVGTYVSEKMGVAPDPLGFVFVEDKRKLALDILEVRYLIEPYIAGRAAKMATKQQIEKMIELCDAVEQMILSGINHIEKDIELHTVIAEASQNLVVSKLLPIINCSIPLFMDVTKNALKNETISTHRSVVEAIASGDEKAAFESMEKHIRYNREIIEKLSN